MASRSTGSPVVAWAGEPSAGAGGENFAGQTGLLEVTDWQGVSHGIKTQLKATKAFIAFYCIFMACDTVKEMPEVFMA